MRRLAIVIPLLLAAVDASAITRHDITGMSCTKVQALVKAEGVAILRHRSARNPGLILYDRYVSDRRYCAYHEGAVSASVRTADRDYCPLRKCVQIEY